MIEWMILYTLDLFSIYTNMYVTTGKILKYFDNLFIGITITVYRSTVSMRQSITLTENIIRLIFLI